MWLIGLCSLDFVSSETQEVEDNGTSPPVNLKACLDWRGLRPASSAENVNSLREVLPRWFSQPKTDYFWFCFYMCFLFGFSY